MEDSWESTANKTGVSDLQWIAHSCLEEDSVTTVGTGYKGAIDELRSQCGFGTRALVKDL